MIRGWEQDCFHELIETVEVAITEDGTAHTTLGYPTERGMEAQGLQVSSLQELRKQSEKSLIVKLLTQDREHHLMI